MTVLCGGPAAHCILYYNPVSSGKRKGGEGAAGRGPGWGCCLLAREPAYLRFPRMFPRPFAVCQLPGLRTPGRTPGAGRRRDPRTAENIHVDENIMGNNMRSVLNRTSRPPPRRALSILGVPRCVVHVPI